MPYLPLSLNGMAYSVHGIAEGLQARGHSVLVVTQADSADFFVNRDPNPALLSYPTFRSTQVAAELPKIMAQWNPDRVIIRGTAECGRIIEACRERRIPFAVILPLAAELLRYGFYEASFVSYVVQTQFSATRLKHWSNVASHVIHPMIVPDSYRTENNARDAILFVNPVPEKGVYAVMELARLLPHRRFLVVESWTVNAEWLAYLQKMTLPNITWIKPQPDMRPLYHQARLLLAPSVWEEGWCRVVSEAQVSGIPTLTTRRGGLPESVGSGGILFDLEAQAPAWAAAIEALFNDPGYYQSLSAAARSHAARAAIQPHIILDQWVQLLTPLHFT